jgi:RimJ/RimL family protein N-acetyltransferase
MLKILSTRAVMRPFSTVDAPEIFACISPEITRFMSWEPPRSLADFAKVWRNWLVSIEDGSDLHLVARDLEEGRFLGMIGLHALQSGRPEFGIWLRQDVHGKRLGHELIGAARAWASKAVPVEYFNYPVAEENSASRRIAEAYGGRVVEYQTKPKYRAVIYHIPPIA